MLNVNYYIYSSPIGYLDIVESEGAITNIDISGKINTSLYHLRLTSVISQAVKELDEYFKGKRKYFDVPISPSGSEFQWKVWQELLKIPYGEKRSYLSIAKEVGTPKGSRAVGQSIGKNPILILIPCHRVLGKDNSITGFSAGIKVKEFLLDLEGVEYRE